MSNNVLIKNKKGYKKTKLGWIPEEWGLLKLGDFFTLTSGITKPDDLHETQECNDNPVYGGNGVIGYSKQVLLNQKVLIIGRVGEKCGCVHYLQTPCWITDNALYINSIKKNFNYEYMYYLLQKINLNKYRNKSGQPLISQKPIYCTIIAMPKIAEQEKIVEILSAWNDEIETLEKLIEQKEIFHKALMKNLLIGKIRLFGYNSKWTHSKFNSIFERITRKNEELNSNILTISAQNGLISQKDFYNKRIASVDTSKYILLKNGEFAYNKSYSNGYPLGAIKRLDLYEKGVVSSLYICFKLNNSDNCSDFWKYYFEAGMLNREIKMIAQEGARNHGLLNMATEDFFNMLLYHPKDSKEQQKIAEILNKSDKEIQLLNSKLEKLKEQKKGLMQKLLTGQIRVKV